MGIYRTALICSFSLLWSVTATAEQFWSSFSLSYLEGSDYEVGPTDRSVVTIEHASGHNWGKSFFFLDHMTDSTGAVSNYMELSPDFSLAYLTGKKLSVGFIEDFYIATTLEGGDFNNYLLGLGLGLKIPGFNYFGVAFYQANNDLWDDDEQLTLTWGLPFNIGSAEFLYDGFLDYSTESDTSAAEMNFTSQLKWNLGKIMNFKSPLYVGIEYAYWTNKFGIEGVDESNPNFLLKWHY